MQYLKLQLDIRSAALTHPNLDNQPKINLIANLVGIFSSSCLHLAPLDQSLCVTVAFLYLKQITTKSIKIRKHSAANWFDIIQTVVVEAHQIKPRIHISMVS